MMGFTQHVKPNRQDIAENAAKEPEGERIRAELEDFLTRNKIVSMFLDTDEHVVEVNIARLPPRIKDVLTKWGSIYVKDCD